MNKKAFFPSLDKTDKALLDALQFDFPLTVRPFLALARRLHISEPSVIGRIRALKESGVVRQISPIFDSARIGYRSTLAAFKVPQRRVEPVAAILSAQPGVSHNYLRTGAFNLWFTLTLPESGDLEREIGCLAKKAGIAHWMYLPAIRTFKVNFRLDMSGKAKPASAPAPRIATRNHTAAVDPAFVREVQADLPLLSRPFETAALRLGVSESAVVSQLRQYVKAGYVKRVAAVLRQNKAGYTSNVMVAWSPQSNDVEKLGAYAASRPLVSHCYERPARPGWPYTVYTMIHGKTDRQVRAAMADIARATGVKTFRELPTVKEFKKVRVTYYGNHK